MNDYKSMQKKSNIKIFYAISFAWQLGFFIIAPISGFFLVGLYIDKWLHSTPLFLIIGLIVGVTITAYEVYHLVIPLIKYENQ